MKKEKYPPINVINVFRGFARSGLPHKITPIRFEVKEGQKHHIQQIRQVHKERVGQAFHYHYVVVTKEQKFFHLIFDTGSLEWRLIQEVDEQLFFNE